MAVHPHNRPHRVDQSKGDFLFSLYNFLFFAKVELKTKQGVFETAADSKDSWRVVSISKSALDHIQETGAANGLRRGHILSRVERAKQLFNHETPLPQLKMLEYFFEHDTVALVTKAENAKDGVGHWSPLIPVPSGLFNAGSFSIYARKGKEIAWVKSLCAEHSIFHIGIQATPANSPRSLPS